MADNSGDAKAPISLPQGGGAIKGIGETFQPNLFSGTGNFSVPIFTSPGRNGFEPQLTLQYSTGNGNGPFGLGWQLSMPCVTRKTEKGLPTYTGEDVFVMSGTEDLVPQLERLSTDPDRWEPAVLEQGDHTISLYRPRTEGQFARVEKWTSQDGDIHWRATTKENVTSIYGRTAAARIIDPQNPDDVFEWLLEETFDTKGNHIAYEYVQENTALHLPGIHEHNRSYTQAYIRRILYGNTPDNLDVDLRVGPTRTTTDHVASSQTRQRHYVFEVVFDYGDISWPLTMPHDLSMQAEGTIPEGWPIREDAFSTFRAGFEIRTLRRCQRVLMLHHFKEGELDGAPLVKSTDMGYTVNTDTRLSLLTLVTVSGYRKDPTDSQRYLKRDMPSVTFTYSAFEPHKQRYQSVMANGGDLPPQALNEPDTTLMDVFGNGLPDILQTANTGFHYWQNLGQGRLDRRHSPPGGQPPVSLVQANVAVGDMGGDGLADLVIDAPPMSGFYESTPDGRWKSFKRFEIMPSFELSDPNTRLVDLTGDGLSDVLVTRDAHFLWYRCQGEAGYDEPRTVPREHDLDIFPDIYFDDSAGRVRLADMSGDGLNDIVLVHDGRIDYWPNMGYGRFGPRITMANTPRIGHGFDPRRLFLVDLDGTGCADMAYVDSGQVHFWFNQSGNGWSAQQTIRGTPYVTDLTAVQFTDFYGTGTATLMWSYDYGEQPGSNYKILDFCGGQKPNLLVEMDNSMGATTHVQYAPSTKFYLEDKANGMPWNTSLPFPVHVIEKTEVIDHISKTKLVTTYKYHQGYYDGREREFRGFGRVDQFDTEFFDDFTGSSLHGDEVAFDNNQQGFYVPPIESRTWFHTGIYFDPDHYVDHRELTQQYRNEYYQGDVEAFRLGEHYSEQSDGTEGPGDTPHEAFRTLRGAVLRTEVYGRDGSVKADHPYAVTENRYWVKALQPKNGNNHAVYLTTPKESISYHYERKPADPRVGHSITLGIDDFGNVTDSVSIGYPRRIVPEDLPEQGETKIVYTRTDFINTYSPPTETAPAFYYAGIPCQTRSYEVTGIDWQSGQAHLQAQRFEELQDTSIDVDTDSFKPYEWKRDETDSGVIRRIIEWTRSYFHSDADPDHIDPIGNLDHRLPLGEIASLALPYEGYQVAFTNSLLHQIYDERTADIDLAGDGGYHPHPDHAAAEGSDGIEEYWWLPSGRQGFDQDRFFQAAGSQDPFGNIATAESDVYALLIEAARDALPAPQTNVIHAKNDYRVLQPYEVTDPNGNRSQVAFDALGLVVGTAVMGEDAEGNLVGDSLDGFVADLPEVVRDRHIANPLNLDFANDTDPHHILKNATTRLVYDVNRFAETGQPNVVYTLARETHISDEHGTPSKIQHAFVYLDGLGRESQTKVQAEPDPTDPIKPRWVGTGTVIYNNKGKPVQEFEPFFSDDHHHGIEQHGVSPTMFYDPSERVVCTVFPDHTYEKVVFDPWQQTTWDGNDTVLLDPRTDPDVIEYVEDYFLKYDRDYEDQHGEPPKTWFQEYMSSTDNAKKEAAQKTEPHANTTAVAHLDTLGRPFLTVADDGNRMLPTRAVLDIEGNTLSVIDARGIETMTQSFDVLGRAVFNRSSGAGDTRMFPDAASKPVRSFTARGHALRHLYDELQRPTHLFVRDAEPGDTEKLVHRTVYGETHFQARDLNLRGESHLVYDGAGIVKHIEFDFKGNLKHSERRLATQYRVQPDWAPLEALTDPVSVEAAATPLLETESFTTIVTYDALDRVTSHTTPDGSLTVPSYNEANLLNKISVSIRGAQTATTFVDNTDYNARGQHIKVEHGNGTTCDYTYDNQTFRLVRQSLTRSGPTPLLQDLEYIYDATGNIVEVMDHQSFGNLSVSANGLYEYDGIYQLIKAEGREHPGQQPTHADPMRLRVDHPNDMQALRRYHQEYQYDLTGNIEQMKHQPLLPGASGWTRSYDYATDSNRLLGTSTPGDPVGQFSAKYTYDDAGSMDTMPHLQFLRWDYASQLQATTQQTANTGAPETTYYTYDATGERVRKVTDHDAPVGEIPKRKQERIYLGDYEVFRDYEGDGIMVKLERETLHVMDDARRVALIETKTQDTNIPPAVFQATPRQRYQVSNHLGSSLMELDEAAQVITYEEYFPFGDIAFHASHSATEVSVKRYRYTGKERDEETGLYYHGARYYAAWLGRWTSADPSGFPGGANLYLYSRNNPIALSDPGGRQPEPEDEEQSIFRYRVKPEDLCQGPCLTDDDVYGELDRSLEKDKQEFERWRKITSRRLGPDRFNANSGRYFEARFDFGRRPRNFEEFFEFGVRRGYFHESEESAVAEIYGEKAAARRKKVEARRYLEAAKRRDRFIAEAKSVKFQVTGNIINGIIAAPVARAIDIGTVAKACAEGSGLECAGAALTVSSRVRGLNPSSSSARGWLTSRSAGTNRTTVVYQLVDEAGDPVYFGISKDYRLATRLNEHAQKFRGNFRGIQVISGPLLEQEARLLETQLIQQYRPILNTAEKSITSPIDTIFVPRRTKPDRTTLNPNLYPR